MLGLTGYEIQLLFIESFIVGIFWIFLTLYVRRGMNPNATGKELKKILDNRLTGEANIYTWYYDAIYGGIATGMMFFFRLLVMKYVRSKYQI